MLAQVKKTILNNGQIEYFADCPFCGWQSFKNFSHYIATIVAINHKCERVYEKK